MAIVVQLVGVSAGIDGRASQEAPSLMSLAKFGRSSIKWLTLLRMPASKPISITRLLFPIYLYLSPKKYPAPAAFEVVCAKNALLAIQFQPRSAAYHEFSQIPLYGGVRLCRQATKQYDSFEKTF